MRLSISPADPVKPNFAGIVSGVDLREPIGEPEVAQIEAGMDRYGVLIFRDQPINDEQHIAFTRHFGPLEAEYGVPGQEKQEGRVPKYFNDISNLDSNNQVLARDDRRRLYSLGAMLWHTDSSYKPTPARYSMLLSRVIPDRGGNTQFADMRGAWEGLDEATKETIRDLVCEHSRLYSRALLGFEFNKEEQSKYTPVYQRLVRRHPSTGRLSLYLSAHAGSIVGWPVPEARALLRDLMEHATQTDYVYSHVWRVHDLVMWDNRVTMHRGRRYPSDQPRDLRRTTTSDSSSTLEQAA